MSKRMACCHIRKFSILLFPESKKKIPAQSPLDHHSGKNFADVAEASQKQLREICRQGEKKGSGECSMGGKGVEKVLSCPSRAITGIPSTDNGKKVEIARYTVVAGYQNIDDGVPYLILLNRPFSV